VNSKVRSSGTFLRIRRLPRSWKSDEQSKKFIICGTCILIPTRNFSDATRPSFSAMLTTAISQASDNPITSTRDEEDSDDWLNVDARDFDNMLEKTMGASKNEPRDAMDVDKPEVWDTEEDRISTEQASRLQDLAQKVENFVEGEGHVEGAKFEE
jgi:hypothetical protein